MQSEAKIQQDAFTEIRNKYPQTYGLLWHCPNGSLRDPVTAAFLKGAGVVRGIPDLHFIWNGKYYLIEVKTPTGFCSTDQKLIHAVHASHGLNTYLFTTSNDIISFVECILNGGDIVQFNLFISPYSRAEMVDVYKAELRAERMKKLKKAA
ncbi:VRR-NUC domain-containing protein [Mucilaginibacter endophyticus]|uniref:VRR-NUC domain-containing protein n=1 Tax=Mucilaginibacter endophyticus TaxID=2675003 RepID=UPI000E0D2876|nr:VRR-NUC domain-containing protein [Mucilaginibacter endophyticus]